MCFSGDPFIIFDGGMPNQNEQMSSKSSSFYFTILRGQTAKVLQMDNSIVDFHVISPSPHIAG